MGWAKIPDQWSLVPASLLALGFLLPSDRWDLVSIIECAWMDIAVLVGGDTGFWLPIMA